MSPARPRSSSSARCTASSMASGDRNASGCSSEAGVVTMSVSVSGDHRLRRAQRGALGERGRDLARRGQRRDGAMRQLRRARPDNRCGNARRGFRAAPRPRPRPAAPRSPCCAARYCRRPARWLANVRTASARCSPSRIDADMRGHHRAQACFRVRRQRGVSQVDRRSPSGARARQIVLPSMSSAMRAAKTTASSSELDASRLAPCAPVDEHFAAGPQAVRARCGRARPPRCRPCGSARRARPGSAALAGSMPAAMQLA